MKKLISLLQPFTLKQKIFVYEDGNKIDAVDYKTTEIVEGLCETAKKYEIKEIDLGGAKKYAQGIGKKVLEQGQTKYSTTFEIKYI